MAHAQPETHVCPKCGRLLIQSGEVLFDDVHLPVFACDDCVVDVDLLGETGKACLTFTLDENGDLLDTAAPDARLWF